MRDRKYVLDPNDLQYKQVETSKSVKVLGDSLVFIDCRAAILYGTIFENRFGAQGCQIAGGDREIEIRFLNGQ